MVLELLLHAGPCLPRIETDPPWRWSGLQFIYRRIVILLLLQLSCCIALLPYAKQCINLFFFFCGKNNALINVFSIPDCHMFRIHKISYMKAMVHIMFVSFLSAVALVWKTDEHGWISWEERTAQWQWVGATFGEKCVKAAIIVGNMSCPSRMAVFWPRWYDT